jgi:hypothetical protein
LELNAAIERALPLHYCAGLELNAAIEQVLDEQQVHLLLQARLSPVREWVKPYCWWKSHDVRRSG